MVGLEAHVPIQDSELREAGPLAVAPSSPPHHRPSCRIRRRWRMNYRRSSKTYVCWSEAREGRCRHVRRGSRRTKSGWMRREAQLYLSGKPSLPHPRRHSTLKATRASKKGQRDAVRRPTQSAHIVDSQPTPDGSAMITGTLDRRNIGRRSSEQGARPSRDQPR